VFAGPSAGFLFLYPVVAYLIGLVRDRFKNHINFLTLFIGILVCIMNPIMIVPTISNNKTPNTSIPINNVKKLI
jgi:biotin transport system substrate-specific component